MAPELVPQAVLSRPEAARNRVALIAAAATGGAALAGLWIRFEDGFGMRLLLAVTSAFFGWLTIQAALSGKSAHGAAGRALAVSTSLGALSTVIPAFILSANDCPGMLIFIVPFGGVFGAMVGFAYGVVLSILAGCAWREATSGTHDGADRAVRIAALWSVLPILSIVLVTFGYDLQRVLPEWASEKDIAAQRLAVPLDFLGLGIAFNVALFSAWFASRRIERRARWLATVVSGNDPRWGTREISTHDDLDRIPRLRPGTTVLEHKNEHAIYRSNATGDAVAII